MTKLTQEKLKELLSYNPETGIFVWKMNRGRNNAAAQKGQIAGCIDNIKGYHVVRINKENFFGHRLAWLYIYGYSPEHDIDHINRDESDNRINNLREVSRQCNTRNCGNYNSNTSGVKGICWAKTVCMWKSYVTLDQKKKFLG